MTYSMLIHHHRSILSNPEASYDKKKLYSLKPDCVICAE